MKAEQRKIIVWCFGQIERIENARYRGVSKEEVEQRKKAAILKACKDYKSLSLVTRDPGKVEALIEAAKFVKPSDMDKLRKRLDYYLHNSPQTSEVFDGIACAVDALAATLKGVE